ncbi:hypothetical protein ACFLT1_08950 [Bacteroidota bacterium]
MRYLFQILWKDQSRSHLLWAVLGTMVGFVLLLSGIHFYQNIKNVLDSNRDLLDPEYIIINKQVNISQTLGLGSTGFTADEIKEIEKQAFAIKVDPFISNEFPIAATTQSKNFPNFYSELFFEAVPNEYIDVKSEEWKWDEDQDVIPIILPQDYLNLYNFGFAQSQGLPQIPKEMISLIQFRIRLKGLHEKVDYTGKIIGFSNRINSILVPYEFLTWANEKFGYQKTEGSSRVIMVSNDPTDPGIMQFIQEKGYDTIKERLKSSRLNIILKFILSFLVMIAAIIIALAFLIFLLSLQLMISRSSRKIKQLHKIGYHYSEISKPYVLVLFILLLIVSTLSLIITGIMSDQLATIAEKWSLEIEPHLSSLVYLVTIVIMTFLFLMNSLAIYISTRRICTR